MTNASGERRGFLRNPFVWYFFVGVIVLTLMRPLLRREPAPPPVLGQLPPYSLIDTTGRDFGSRELAGQVYVTDFIFTRCTSICPLLSRAMASLQARFREAGVEGVHLVSISIDPEYDTPARLAEYAAEHGADPARWTFLTGAKEQIVDLVVGGFKSAVGEPVQAAEDLVDIAHAGHFVLVDGSGRVRGYYGTDEAGLDEVFHRAQHVLKQQRR